MKFNFVSGQFEERSTGLKRTAVIGTDRRLTWSELEAEVAQLVKALRTHHKSAGPVIIYGHKEAGMVSSILACLQSNIPYVPIDNIVPEARVRAVMEIAKADLILCTSEKALEGAPSLKVPELNFTGTTLTKEWSGLKDLAYIIFTSGSTGEPKGVQITRRNVADLFSWVSSSDFGFNENDVLLNQCSFSFDVSFFDVLAALHCGACLSLNSPDDLKSKMPFASRLSNESATIWSSTPSFLSLALTSATFDAEHFPDLKYFYVAGEVVHSHLVQRLWKRFPNGELWNAYGPTEATVITTLVHVSQEILEKYPSVPIGKVKPGVQMPTSAADNQSEGELWIIGDNVSPGYLNRPDLNETRFAVRGGKRAYLTGDLAFHQDGLIFYKGRIDSQIKLHGYRIELDEIDNQILKMPEVEEAATIGLRRDGDVKKLVCFVKGKSAAPDRLSEKVREHLSAHLPYYMIPADIRVVTELPYNANHKVDRGALARQLEGGL